MAFKVLTPRKRPYFAGYAAPAKRARFVAPKGPTATFKSANRRTAGGPTRRGSLQQQIKSLQKVVKEILPEIKNIGIDLAQTNITSSGTIQHLTAIPQGVTEVTRVGEDVMLREIIVRGRLSDLTTTGTTSVPFYYRFALVVDKQQVADTAPAVTQVVDTADPVNALPNNSHSERFRFLWVSPLIQNNAVLTGNQFPVCDHTWKGALKIGFNGANSTDIQKNGVYFMILTSDTGNTVDFAGVARLMYTDS